MAAAPRDIDEYIEGFPPKVRVFVRSKVLLCEARGYAEPLPSFRS